MRKTTKRTVEAVWKPLGKFRDTILEREYVNYLRNSGYRLMLIG